MISAYTDAQLSDMILLETDSPYMPVYRSNKVNTPAYLCDVVKTIARCRVSLRELLALSDQWPSALLITPDFSRVLAP